MDTIPERDCTPKCRSSIHAKKIMNSVTFATPSQLRTYSVWLCHNFAVVTDELGRNLLHMASTCGKWEIVEWLLKRCGADVDVKDLESGWTSLHRSFFYGQLASARVLCMHGASLRVTDHEGCTPLDIIMKDRLPYIEYIASDPSDVYSWGSNSNYNLGLGNSKSRQDPEILESFRKNSIDLKQVVISKFHSAFLSTNGKVYTCGYGHGGRLGQETEDITLVPSLVKGLGTQSCIQIAAGQDHLLLLLENGQVWSCGLNVYHQLGHIPPTERLLVPKAIPLKFLKGKAILGICAARFHSVIHTKDSVYTFGLNAGQLGHPKGDRTQIQPRQVSGLSIEECRLTHVETSDGAIVCATSRGDVYVLHEYQIRKIASRQLEISKLSVVGGHLDSRCDVAGVREGGGLELRVALLTKSGKLYLWRQTDPYLRRCIFNSPKELIISNIHINHYSIGMITSNNEAYLGSVVPFKTKRPAPPSMTLHNRVVFNSKPALGLTVLLDTEDCHYVKVKKLPYIYRGTSISSDSKGRNFAVLQSNPKMGLVEVPMISESKMQQDFSRFYLETSYQDDFHDIIIKVEKKEFAAHRYILASRSDYFKKRFNNEGCGNMISIENTRPEAFEQVLKYIYTNHCDFLTANYEVRWIENKENGKKSKSSAKNSKTSNPVQIVQEVSRKLNLNRLAKKLERVRLVNGRISLLDTDLMPRLTFNRKALPAMSDVNLISSDGSVYGCHKCILACRLDYFHSMLSTCWAENSLLGNLSLPIPSQIMEVLIDYMYTDETTKITDSEDVEFLCNILMTVDQLLIPRLKEICEATLVKLITLKNAAELLELSSIYNSVQLKNSCMQFICINLAAIIESKVLEVVSDNVMEELSTYYRSLVPLMHRRRILPFKCVLEEDLELLESQFPISDACEFEKNDCHESKSKTKRRSSHLRSDLKDIPADIKNASRNTNIGKSIVLDVLTPDPTKTDDISKSPEVKEVLGLKSSCEAVSRTPSTRVMNCLPKDVVLKSIMDEELNLTPLPKKKSSDMKPIPQLSQKQRKKLAAEKARSIEIAVPNSPPNQSSCPWAILQQQSPPSSFWDAVANKELPSSPLNREFSVPVKCNSSEKTDYKSQASSSPIVNTEDLVLSFHDIQKDEEQKLQRAINPKIKPLHILNIEDQAIEELCALYNVNDNHKEKITISRVRPKEIASPIWRRSGR